MIQLRDKYQYYNPFISKNLNYILRYQNMTKSKMREEKYYVFTKLHLPFHFINISAVKFHNHNKLS